MWKSKNNFNNEIKCTSYFTVISGLFEAIPIPASVMCIYWFDQWLVLNHMIWHQSIWFLFLFSGRYQAIWIVIPILYWSDRPISNPGFESWLCASSRCFLLIEENVTPEHQLHTNLKLTLMFVKLTQSQKERLKHLDDHTSHVFISLDPCQTIDSRVSKSREDDMRKPKDKHGQTGQIKNIIQWANTSKV